MSAGMTNSASRRSPSNLMKVERCGGRADFFRPPPTVRGARLDWVTRGSSRNIRSRTSLADRRGPVMAGFPTHFRLEIIRPFPIDERGAAEEVAMKKIATALAIIALLGAGGCTRSEEHTSELQSLMRISYAVFCLKKKKSQRNTSQL